MHFVDPSVGWAVGDGGTIVKTTNGGTTWTAQDSGTTDGLCSVDFVNASTGWAVGDGGVILKTANGGTTWSVLPSGTTQALQSVHFISTTNRLGGRGEWVAGRDAI